MLRLRARSEVCMIPPDVIFYLKFILNSNFFKMLSVRVCFSSGFPLGGGFSPEQFLLRKYSILLCGKVQPEQPINTHVVLCMNRIPPEQKNRFPEVLCVFSNTARANTRQFAPWKIPFSAEIRIQQEQPSPEDPPPKSSRTPQEEPHFVALSARATSPLLLQSLTTTLERLALWEILLLEEIQGYSVPVRSPL
jgi:hypothetical protein